jgi:hypothetical protein
MADRKPRGKHLMLNLEVTDIKGLPRYDLPFKYVKACNCYLVTLQKGHLMWPTVYEVSVNDRALPYGLVQSFGKSGKNMAYLYAPGHTGDATMVEHLGTFTELNTAIGVVISEYLRSRHGHRT